MKSLRNALCLITALLLLALTGSGFAEDQTALFEQAAAALQTPKEEALETGAVALRPGDTVYVPSVAPEITPYDALATQTLPAVNGTFESSDEAIVTVDAQGRMTAQAEGTATVTYHAATGDVPFTVTVSAAAVPELAKALVYVARREFYETKRARLPKYNKYAQWYYGKKKEVGWCSVFTIWCANASGNNPLQEESVTAAAQSDVVYFREGQVGNQYDGFFKLNRFVAIPRPGYTVIYGDLSNGYRVTHIGLVVDVADRGVGVYQVTTVEGNMSNTVKSYTYLYDSKAANNTVGVEKGKRLQENMSRLPSAEQTDPLVQYALHTDHWCVFGFGVSWL